MPEDWKLPVDMTGYDPATGVAYPTTPAPDFIDINPVLGELFGVGGHTRYQTWPERLVRSATTLPGDVASGQEPVIDPETGRTSEKVIQRAGDLATFAGGGSFAAVKPGEASLMAGMNKMAPKSEIVPTFYSVLENTVKNAKMEKGTPDQWIGYLKNNGIKNEELEFTLGELPSGQITKKQLEDTIASNKVQVNDVWKGELKFNKDSKYALPEVVKAAKEAGSTPGELEMTLANDGNAYRALTKKFPDLSENENWAELVSKDVFGGDSIPKGTTKYHGYQLPGGENYRELLMTLPNKDKLPPGFKSFKSEDGNYGIEFPNGSKIDGWRTEEDAIRSQLKQSGNPQFISSHWPDDINPVAHVRMNDRAIPDVGKSLHVEEIQSDWHQKGRKQGYDIPVKSDKYIIEGNGPWTIRNKETGYFVHDFNNKQHAEGYLKDIQLGKILPLRKEGLVPNAPFKKTWDELALKRVLREAAEKNYDAISWTPGEAQAARYDLKIGGEGMKAFYNKMLVDKANSLVKKYGGKVEKQDLFDSNAHKIVEGQKASKGAWWIENKKGESIGPDYKSKEAAEQAFKEKSKPVHVIKLTPELKKAALEKGFPLFSAGVPILSPVDYDPFKSKYKLTPVDGNPFDASK